MRSTIPFFLCLLLFQACFSNSKEEKGLLIATAANMQFAMADIAKAFEEDTHINCNIISSSSGKLTAQIIAGAPYDVFVSADAKYPAQVFQKGLAIAPARKYAQGKLILWSNTLDSIPSLASLQHSSIEKIALANPKTAPYGKAAQSVLQILGLEESLKGKLVFGESIAQVNRFIERKNATIGFTTIATIHTDLLKGQGVYYLIPDSLYQPIEQSAIVIKGKQEAKAKSFYEYLFSERSKAILAGYGYKVD